MWKYIIIATVITVIGTGLAIGRKNNIRKMSLTFTTALSLAISVLVFPYYRASSDLPIAIIESIRAGLSGISMGGDGDIPYDLELTDTEFLVYRFFLYALYVIGPIAGSLFLFSFSSKIYNALSLLGQKRFHVFSNLNEKSIRIAESIVSEKVGGKIIFCNAKDADPALDTRARTIDALLLEGEEDSLHLLKDRKYEFYEIEEDGRENIRSVSRLCKKLLKKKNYEPENTIVRIFADDSQRELILNLDRQYAEKIYLRHINENSSLTIEALTLSEDLLAVKENCHVAIVSDDAASIDLLKGLICQLIKPEGNYRIRLIGPSADKLYETFLKDAPEGGNYPVDAVQCPVGKEAECFEEGTLPDAVFVLCEEDEYAFDTAVRIKQVLSSRGKGLSCPKIYCRIKGADLHSIIREEGIVLYGNAEKTCSYENLIHPDLEKAAERVHLSYLASGEQKQIDPSGIEKRLKESGFYQYQNQESSFAMALALRYKEKYILSFKEEETVSDVQFIEEWLSKEENRKKMADAEHDRWCAYQRVHGWRRADRKQTEAIIEKYEGRRANDPELRLHPALVSNAKLAQTEKTVNTLLEKYGSDYRVYYLDADIDIIDKMVYILDRK